MGEEALLKIEPEALDRVQLGRVGWQRNQRDVGRHGKLVRAMPARLVEDHDRMLVLSDGFREVVEEDLHCGGIGIGHHEREGIVRARLDGGEDIGKGKTLVAKPRRPLAPLPPDMADAAFLADPRFVLEPDFDRLAASLLGGNFVDEGGEAFLKSAAASRSCA